MLEREDRFTADDAAAGPMWTVTSSASFYTTTVHISANCLKHENGRCPKNCDMYGLYFIQINRKDSRGGFGLMTDADMQELFMAYLSIRKDMGLTD